MTLTLSLVLRFVSAVVCLECSAYFHFLCTAFDYLGAFTDWPRTLPCYVMVRLYCPNEHYCSCFCLLLLFLNYSKPAKLSMLFIYIYILTASHKLAIYFFLNNSTKKSICLI
uniref:Secreted protein n=1 Tax=Ixodes ricinus TaxID=34613 RepID=A0A147BBP7_IXORI